MLPIRVIINLSVNATLCPAMDGPHGLTRPLGQRSTEPGDNNLGPYLNRVIWSLAALSTLFLGLRVYCKFLRRRQLWWDDYVLIASWVITLSMPFCSLPTEVEHV